MTTHKRMNISLDINIIISYNIHHNTTYHGTFALHRDIWIIKKAKRLHFRCGMYLVSIKFRGLKELTGMSLILQYDLIREN